MGETVSFEADEEYSSVEAETGRAETGAPQAVLDEMQDLILSTSDMQEFLNELAQLVAKDPVQ